MKVMTPLPIEELRVGEDYLDVALAVDEMRCQNGVNLAQVDFRVLAAGDPATQSGQARRAMEQLAIRHSAVRPLRVATLVPSGRPVVMHAGKKVAVQVSASHTGGLIGVACRAGHLGVGVDLVQPDSAGPGLDWWAAQSDVCDRPGERIRRWAAREAAYKAARLDSPFYPLRVEVRLDKEGFDWRINTSDEPISGRGGFLAVGSCLLAVAVEWGACPEAVVGQEVAACS